jgi:hypothetical protein
MSIFMEGHDLIYEKVIFRVSYYKIDVCSWLLTWNQKSENRDEIYMRAGKFASRTSGESSFNFHSYRAEENRDFSPHNLKNGTFHFNRLVFGQFLGING